MAESKAHFPEGLRLKPGVSLSQTRFALANFCLSHFGSDGQYYADILELCTDSARLQQALDSIAAEVAKSCPERMATLAACVREANDTDLESSATKLPRGAPATAPSAAARAERPAAPAAAADPLRLLSGISLAQARFSLSDFCLDQFGARSQQLVDAINACSDVRGIQEMISGITAELKEQRGDALQQLIDCVREINATSE